MTKVVDFIKKNIVLCVCFISFIILFIVMTFLGAFKKGTFSLDDETNKIIISCPATFNAGEVVECDVSLSLVDNSVVYSVNANYDFEDGISYESFGVTTNECSGSACFEALEINDEGFAVINLDGVSNSFNFGKLRVKMPENVSANDNYKIGLKEIELSYGDNIESLSLDNSFTFVRSKNNVATLSSLSISNVTLNETFDSNVFDYSASVNSDVSNINISYELTDENSSVSGDIGNVNVHFGTNKYTIKVISEDGIVENTYNLNIYREYEFSTNKYVYNKEDNYIYTGTDTGEKIISNLDLLNDNLKYSIKGKQLCVIYGDDEELLCINIINFSTSYSITNKVIYINNNLTYQGLLDTITSEGIEYKLFNNDGNEITDYSTIINNNYKLNLYYNDVLLDSYNLINEYLHVDESLIIDDESKMIKRLKIKSTVGELKEKFDTNGSIKVTYDGNEVSDTELVKSGEKLIITVGNTTVTYTLSVLGDVTGDGIIDIDDIGILYRYFLGKRSLSNYSVAAGEITSDGMIDIDDVGILYRYFLGKRSSLEG